MSAMNCSQFLDHIDEWVEGQEIAGARDHSRECSQCRSLAEDLASIRLAAVILPEADGEPSPRIWKALRADLVREGLVREGLPHEGVVARPEGVGWLHRVFSFVPRPALAGAYVAALVAAGVMLSGPGDLALRQARWLERTQSSSAQLSAQLQDAEADQVAALSNFSPALTDDLRKNLSIVDNDIALCEKSVREQPDNEIARDYLYTAYEQKADLLALISERGDGPR